MTSGFHLAATQICNALRIFPLGFTNFTQPTGISRKVEPPRIYGDVCLEAALAAWDAGADFLSAEALIDSANNPYSHELIIVCPVDGCGTSFSEKIPYHAQLGTGPLDISDKLQHYFIIMLAKHYMAWHSIHDLPIPNTH